MMEFLIFNLYGPMASWGDIAVGEQRPSFSQPTKSAIMGLLAAALGLRRNEDNLHIQLQASVGFAVRVNHAGELLRDYHTTQAPSQKKGKVFRTRRDEIVAQNLNTILSQRDYQTDASYTVILWMRDNSSPWSLSDFKQALLIPEFTLYLGRKSCPLALPLEPEIVQTENLYQAFCHNKKADNFLNYLSDPESVSIYWEELSIKQTGFPQQAFHWQNTRRDAIASRKRWQFGERKENYISLPLGEGD